MHTPCELLRVHGRADKEPRIALPGAVKFFFSRLFRFVDRLFGLPRAGHFLRASSNVCNKH